MWQYNYSTQYTEDELMHYGVKGMKWGVRRSNTGYKSTGIRSAMARRKNEKVDKSFKNWNENAQRKSNAISLGKKANEARRAYEGDRKNKSLKSNYKQANKEYKKAYRKNTTYRKGAIKKEVLSDMARKHLSDAKKVKKQLDVDPKNRQLRKQYSKLMSAHDVERAKARRAPEVATNRMRKKASMKRAMTMTIKGAATTAAVSAGAYAANRYLSSHNVTLNGKDFRIDKDKLNKFKRAADFGKQFMRYV